MILIIPMIVLHILLYEYENWAVTKGQGICIQHTEMRFLRQVTGRKILDHRRNIDVQHKLHIMGMQEGLPNIS